MIAWRQAGLSGIAVLAAFGCTVTEGSGDPTGGGGGAGAGTVGTVQIEDLGSETVDSTGETEITVSVPEGAQSFAVVVDGAGAELVIANKIVDPDGLLVFDFDADVNTNRTDATDGLYTVLVPTNPEVAVTEGDWVLNLRSGGGSFEASVKSILKTAPGSDQLLDLNFYFVGLDGMDAEKAQTDPGIATILENVSAIYQGVGLSVRAITYQDVTGDDASTYGVLDSDAELASMFQLSPVESNLSLNLFLVADIAIGGGDFSILGLAGGVPGPPVLQGTSRSGVAINMGSYLSAIAMADDTAITNAARELEIIIAHETGHFLGLYHTVERNGLALANGSIQGQDPLQDTALCPDSADANADGLLEPDECTGQGADNLMFWSPANDSRALTSGQAHVMLANPLVH